MSYLLELARSSTAMAVLLISTAVMLMVAIGFLVAASVLRRANNRKAAHWARLERNWGAAIEGILHGAAAETLHSIVQPGERLVLLDYLYKSSVTEERQGRRALYVELARPYLAELATRARTGDVWQRARALRTLAELGGSEHDDVIIAALDDEAPHVALTAARTYARLGLGPIEPLLERIERYQAWDRRLLRLTLASLGRHAAPALHARLADGTVPSGIRTVCADTLAELAWENANDTAIAILREDADVELRAAALRLIRAPVADAQRAVVRELCNTHDPMLRAQAVACLSRIAEPSDVPQLERALADISPWVVLHATRGLTAQQRPATEYLTPAAAGAAREWK